MAFITQAVQPTGELFKHLMNGIDLSLKGLFKRIEA